MQALTGVPMYRSMHAQTMALCLHAMQAWGARAYRQIGIILQRGLVVTLLMCSLVGMAWHWAMPLVLPRLGQDPAVAARSLHLLHLLAPALVAAALSEPQLQYLQAQGQVAPMMVTAVAVLAIAPLLNWLFIFRHAALSCRG
jgi:MATE family multidrug resistance protein